MSHNQIEQLRARLQRMGDARAIEGFGHNSREPTLGALAVAADAVNDCAMHGEQSAAVTSAKKKTRL